MTSIFIKEIENTVHLCWITFLVTLTDGLKFLYFLVRKEKIHVNLTIK